MKKLLLVFLPLLIFISCGRELETVTVRPDQSELFATADSVVDKADSSAVDNFVHIKIGEIAAVESLDPLYANSNSEWRVINLLYEGLVRLDEAGNPAPAIAQRWQVNNDSTQFTFHLKSNKRYHSSSLFDGGNGRPVKAADVRFVFQRMASADVPPFVASYFEDIRGFKAYQAERNQVKTPGKRVYDTIEGIRIQNDSTLTFYLQQSAPDFLKRLAHPMASVYAPESVKGGSGAIQQSAGSGTYRFIRKENGSHLLTMAEKPAGKYRHVNRLDIISGLNEKDLYQQFAREKLDALIELGPSTNITLSDSAGNFLQDYYHNYEITETGVRAGYNIYYNRQSNSEGLISSFLSALNEAEPEENPDLGTIQINAHLLPEDTSLQPKTGQMVITHSAHPFRVFMLNKLATIATESGLSLSMNASYAMWPEITLSHYPYSGTEELLRWEVPVQVLSHKNKVSISFEHQPWNMSVNVVQKNR